MNKFQLTPRERAAYNALYLSSLSRDGDQAIASGRYYDLEERWPQLADINLNEKRYFQQAVDEIRKWKAPKKVAQCREDARRALSRLDGMISMMHGRVLQEEFEDSYFRIDPPLDLGYSASPTSADFSYSWKQGEQWHHGRITFTGPPSTPKPEGNDWRSRERVEVWRAQNRGWLINNGYYKLRDYLAEMETGEGLPNTCDVSKTDSLLPEGRRYNLHKYLFVKEAKDKAEKEAAATTFTHQAEDITVTAGESQLQKDGKVTHQKFGDGVIVSVDGNKIEVEFGAPYHRKQIMSSFLTPTL